METNELAAPKENPTTCFLVRVSTGCTCCSDDNFIEGPYRHREKAEEAANQHQKQRTLSSQYAEFGHQEILEVPCERVGDWIIIDGMYAVKDAFVDDEERQSFDYQLDMFRKDYRL